MGKKLKTMFPISFFLYSELYCEEQSSLKIKPISTIKYVDLDQITTITSCMFLVEVIHLGAVHHTIFMSSPVVICVVPGTLLLQCCATLVTSTSYVRPQSSEGRTQ